MPPGTHLDKVQIRAQEIENYLICYQTRLPSVSYRIAFDIWWAWVDSNYRPHPYQGCALTN
jgi:hypothetical protein